MQGAALGQSRNFEGKSTLSPPPPTVSATVTRDGSTPAILTNAFETASHVISAALPSRALYSTRILTPILARSPIIESVGFTAPKISFAGWNCAVGFTAARDVSNFSRVGFPASSFESSAFAAVGASFAAATARPTSQNLLLGIVLEATNKALV
jgi:hypothetical protein